MKRLSHISHVDPTGDRRGNLIRESFANTLFAVIRGLRNVNKVKKVLTISMYKNNIFDKNNLFF